MPNQKKQIVGHVALGACWIIWLNAHAQQETAPVSPPAAVESVDLKVFKGPAFIKPPSASYPESERMRGDEGWVTLNFMIDPQGKPYEVSVTGSTGNAAFERTAVKAVENTTFQPARIGDAAVDSSFMMKMKFHMADPARGAAPTFVSAYRKLAKAIDADDRTQADELLASLKVQNLYEEAYRQLGLYHYARKWGTEAMQLSALHGAVAGEEDARYLSRDQFRSALSETLRLELKRNDFGSALQTWEKFKKIARKEEIAVWKSTIDEVEAARKDGRQAHLSDEIGTGGSWFGTLFKNRFEIRVASGKVEEIKLRCEKRYVFFRYDPELQYTVGDPDDQCSIELVGQPNTRFTLVQTRPQ